jgi:hypothetical protein
MIEAGLQDASNRIVQQTSNELAFKQVWLGGFFK